MKGFSGRLRGADDDPATIWINSHVLTGLTNCVSFPTSQEEEKVQMKKIVRKLLRRVRAPPTPTTGV